MAVEVVVFTSAVAPSGVNIGDFATFWVSGHVTPGCGLSRDKLVFVVFRSFPMSVILGDRFLLQLGSNQCYRRCRSFPHWMHQPKGLELS